MWMTMRLVSEPTAAGGGGRGEIINGWTRFSVLSYCQIRKLAKLEEGSLSSLT